MRNAAEKFSFGPNPTRAKKTWSSSTCLLYAVYCTLGRGGGGRRSERRYSKGATVHKYHIVPSSMGATVHKLGRKYKP